MNPHIRGSAHYSWSACSRVSWAPRIASSHPRASPALWKSYLVNFRPGSDLILAAQHRPNEFSAAAAQQWSQRHQDPASFCLGATSLPDQTRGLLRLGDGPRHQCPCRRGFAATAKRLSRLRGTGRPFHAAREAERPIQALQPVSPCTWRGSRGRIDSR